MRKIDWHLALMSSMGLLISGCTPNNGPDEIIDTGTKGQVEGVIEVDNVGQIFENARAYIGQAVVVEGEVNRVEANDAFRLATGDIPFAKDSIMVLSKEGALRPKKGEKVRVRGTVRPADLKELRGDVDRELPDDLFALYDRRVVIVADEITGL